MNKQDQENAKKQTLKYCIERLLSMVESISILRMQGITPSKGAIKIANAYGEAVKRKFQNVEISIVVDEIIRFINYGEIILTESEQCHL